MAVPSLPIAVPLLIVMSAGLAVGRPLAPVPATPPTLYAPSRVVLSFQPGRHWYTFTLTLTTADGKRRPLPPLRVEQNSPGAARDLVFNYIQDSGWEVEKAGTATLAVYAHRPPGGPATPAESGKAVIVAATAGRPTLVTAGGDPATQQKPPSDSSVRRAVVPPGAFARFDLHTLPEAVGRPWELTVELQTSRTSDRYIDRFGPADGYVERDGLGQVLASGLERLGFKAEVQPGGRVRVTGRNTTAGLDPVATVALSTWGLAEAERPTIAPP